MATPSDSTLATPTVPHGLKTVTVQKTSVPQATATRIDSGLAGRRRLRIRSATATGLIYLGYNNQVDADNGFPIDDVTEVVREWDDSVQVWVKHSELASIDFWCEEEA